MTRKTDLPSLQFERELWKSGVSHIAGLDEAGRGALAGPVAVGAVVLPPDVPHLPRTLAGCRDSKQMTPRQRDQCAPIIKEIALVWSVSFAAPEEIDALGIVGAIRLAGMRAVASLSTPLDFLLTDFRLELPESELPQTSLPKGDERCLSIAAASILAKTTRDAYMRELDSQYPGYGLGQNKGYGTQAHRSEMKRLGYSPVHRKTFQIKE
jgi:ribonuclease HII